MIDLYQLFKKWLCGLLGLGLVILFLKISQKFTIKGLFVFSVIWLILLAGLVQMVSHDKNENSGGKDESQNNQVRNSMGLDVNVMNRPDELRNFNFRDIGFGSVGTKRTRIVGGAHPKNDVLKGNVYGGALTSLKNKDLEDEKSDTTKGEIVSSEQKR